MEQKITITIKDGKTKFLSEGLNNFEILGCLRFIEKDIWLKMQQGQQAPPKIKRTLIKDWIESQPELSVRLINVLKNQVYLKEKMEYVDEVTRRKFYTIKDAGAKSWAEFCELTGRDLNKLD